MQIWLIHTCAYSKRHCGLRYYFSVFLADKNKENKEKIKYPLCQGGDQPQRIFLLFVLSKSERKSPTTITTPVQNIFCLLIFFQSPNFCTPPPVGRFVLRPTPGSMFPIRGLTDRPENQQTVSHLSPPRDPILSMVIISHRWGKFSSHFLMKRQPGIN